MNKGAEKTSKLLVRNCNHKLLGSESYWNLPHTVRKDGETMRQTAERAITSHCGNKIKFNVLGNAPLSYSQFKYAKSYREKTDKTGAKVFLFKAYLDQGFHDDVMLTQGENVLDHQWATLEELKEILDKDTFKSLANMLHSED